MQAQPKAYGCEVTHMKEMNDFLWKKSYTVERSFLLLTELENGLFEITIYSEEEPYLIFFTIDYVGTVSASESEDNRYILEQDWDKLYAYGATVIKEGQEPYDLGLYFKKPLSNSTVGQENHMYITHLQNGWSTIMYFENRGEIEVSKKRIFVPLDE